MSRPDLYELLWRHVPKECVFLDKKVVNFDDDAEGVLLRCADGTSYQGDILIGADGAYSAVRSHMYKMLKTRGLLPDVDDAPLPFHTVSLVGQTVELDPDEFPDLKMELSQFKSVLGSDNMCTVSRNFFFFFAFCFYFLLLVPEQRRQRGLNITYALYSLFLSYVP